METLVKRRFSLSMRWFVAVAASLACLLWLFAAPKPGVAGNERVITIYYDGREQTIVTDAATVGEALERADVTLSEQDNVEPARETQLIAPSYNINIYRARPVTVVDGEYRREIVSAHTSARQIAADAGLELYDEDQYELDRIDNFVNDDGIGLKLTIFRSKPVSLLLYGQKVELRTMADTIEEFIQEKELKLADGDELWPALDTRLKPGMTVALFAEGTMDIDIVSVDFPVKKIQDADRPLGYREIVAPGVKGKRYVVAQVVNGQRKVLHSYVLQPPKEQVEIIGSRGSLYSSNEQLLYDLRMCESGGRYDRNSGNGYYGAYQFSIETWDRVAPKVGRADLSGVRPDKALPADQDFMVIQNAILSTGGFASQHPGCYEKLGLPIKPL